ncbi:The BTB (BR-C, ttk and bab)/POZ (Pox virus and Zinc finger) domain [Ceratobasidium sp. AG-Ba]|nr:The BTB (BR-C, ttk and bab)/POZ (Pox virus and Zinc finger) domain [Ceratobasidium sp. AG-Ba]
MAQKYNIEGISATIDYIISRSFDGNSPLGLDPVETFALAASHQLKAGQKAAARSVKLLEDVEDFENLARALPQYSGIIGLLGAQSMRTKVLVKVLANLQRLDAIPSREGGYHVDQYDVMICRECRDKLSYTLEPYMGYRPDWVYRWATTALNELVNKSLSECEHLFHISILHELGEDRGCRDCIRAALEVKDGECFKSWAEDMRSELQDALRGVDCLYGL